MSDQPHFDVQPSVGNHYAWMRTLLGLQRTLMAAVRTGVSLIGFGFTVAKFFEQLQGDVPDSLKVLSVNSPRNLGLVLIGAGVISLAMFTYQYHTAVAYLKSEPFAAIAIKAGRSLHRPTYLAAYAVLLIGIFAFASVFLRF